jgi:translation initiation factor IF-2
MARKIAIAEMVTVGKLAEKLSLPATELISELFKNGVMATINEKIDFDTAQILVNELNLDVELVKGQNIKEQDKNIQKDIKIQSKTALPRPPVVAAMGHVDHGKTSLLDVIRGDNVVAKESGGITQHISAYQITHNKRKITFLDTPGHEAFAALREHGAYLTDIAIIVIAADDGIKPQTLEAIRFARKAGTQIIIAITKIDKSTANIDRVKQQLSEQKLMPEDWGGDTVIVPVSSKTKQGIDKLLDMIILLADVEEFKAEVNEPGRGLIIESHMEKGRGAIAVALVQQGTLKHGDYVVAGPSYAKVKVLENTAGKIIKSATPSTPVIICGFKSLPEFGDQFQVVQDEKTARKIAHSQSKNSNDSLGHLEMSGSDLMHMINRKTSVRDLNVIVKADVQGSLTSVVDCLKTLDTNEVTIRIVGSGVGVITENDIRMAISSNAIVYGFHVNLPTNIKRVASQAKVSVRLFKVIYELLDDAKKELSSLLAPEEIINNVGRLLVKGVFKTTKTETIAGGEVTKGKLVIPSFANVHRGDDIIAKDVTVINLKHGPTDTKEILEGELGGISLATNNRLDLQEGDKIEVYTKEIRQRTL